MGVLGPQVSMVGTAVEQKWAARGHKMQTSKARPEVEGSGIPDTYPRDGRAHTPSLGTCKSALEGEARLYSEARGSSSPVGLGPTPD